MKKLDTIFATGFDGALYELPLEAVGAYRVSAERLQQLGHAPLPPGSLLSGNGGGDEVTGHHQLLTGGTEWTFHRDWCHGAFVDPTDGHYYVGMHRHPFGDFRVEKGRAQDFA